MELLQRARRKLKTEYSGGKVPPRRETTEEDLEMDGAEEDRRCWKELAGAEADHGATGYKDKEEINNGIGIHASH